MAVYIYNLSNLKQHFKQRKKERENKLEEVDYLKFFKDNVIKHQRHIQFPHMTYQW